MKHNQPTPRSTILLTLLTLAGLSLSLLGATCKRKMKKIDQYHRELWTAEADENLDRINQGLKTLWQKTKNKASFQFPAAGPTPSQVVCGTRPQKPTASMWKGAWAKIGFSINKPFRYQYQIISSGRGKEAKFTIRAHGNLDCDDEHSTYELLGAIDAKGRVHNFDGKRFDEEKAAE